MNFYEYNDYRDLVTVLLEEKLGRGAKVKLAEALNCNPGYISQVLNKTKIHFSPENMVKICSFLKLDQFQEEFLMFLLHLGRAGSKDLENFWEKKVSWYRKQHLKVEKQVKNISQELTDEAKAVYYSHWAYCAAHMLVSIENFNSADQIGKKLKIPNVLATKILKFLEENQLIIKNKEYFQIGKTRIHLKSDSPLVKTHHQNFRNKAIISLEEENDFDLHYSAVLTLSKKDANKIRLMLLKFIEEKEKILIPSPNEEIIALNLDLFKF